MKTCKCCTNVTIGQRYLLFLWGNYLLHTYLIDQVLAIQIGQMRSLFIVGKMCPNAIDHHQNQGAIIHVQPIASSNKLVRSIPRERAVGVGTKIGFVKAGMGAAKRLGCRISSLRCDPPSWKLYPEPRITIIGFSIGSI